MSARLVVARTYNRSLDAHIARSRLEASGIEAFVPDDQVTSIDPLLIYAMGGVRLQVRERDLERAVEVLDEPDLESDDDDDLEEGPRCPSCGSVYWTLEWSASQLLVALPLLGVPFRFMEKRARCKQCEAVWSPGEAPPGKPRLHAPYRALLSPQKRAGKPVFRLRRDRGGLGAMAGLFLGLIGALSLSVDAGLLVLAGLFAGWLAGRSFSFDVCSEPDCRAPLPRGQTTCPRCKGHVEWVINRAAEHFTARAEWHRLPESDAGR